MSHQFQPTLVQQVRVMLAPTLSQGSVVTSLQPQQSRGLIVSSQPILPRVVPTYQGPLLSSMPSTSNKPVLVAPGLPSVPQKMIDKIKREEYNDFHELPLARGLSKSLPPHLEVSQLLYKQMTWHSHAS